MNWTGAKVKLARCTRNEHKFETRCERTIKNYCNMSIINNLEIRSMSGKKIPNVPFGAVLRVGSLLLEANKTFVQALRPGWPAVAGAGGGREERYLVEGGAM